MNKSHGWVHSKARATMGSRTVLEALYIFTNEPLLHKTHTKPANLASFESFVASLSIGDSERSDVLTSLSTIEIGDYLPAIEPTPPCPCPARRR